MFRWPIAFLILALAMLLSAPPALAWPEESAAREVTLIRGLDGGTYEPYAPAVVKQVQDLVHGDPSGGPRG